MSSKAECVRARDGLTQEDALCTGSHLSTVVFINGPLALWHIDGNHKLIRWVKNVFGGSDQLELSDFICVCT